MPMNPPYLIVGFDVDPADPNGPTVIEDVQHDFPLTGILPLGVENVFALEVPLSQMNARFQQVRAYLAQKDQDHGGVLRWVVQLCHSSEISVG
jgi:hypothetical protein